MSKFINKLFTNEYRQPHIAGYASGVCTIFYSIFFFCLLSALPTYATGATSAPTIGYDLKIQLKPDAHILEGVATLDFPPAFASNALRLVPWAEISSVASFGRQIPFTFRNGLLAFDRTEIGSNGQLTIAYRAVFNDPLPRETVGIEDPSFGVGATIQGEGSYLSAGTAWYPRADGVPGSHRVRVVAPQGVVAVTAGRFLGSDDGNGLTVSSWENKFPLDGLAVSAGRFRVAADDLDGIQLLTFLSPDNADLAPGYLTAMRRHLTYYRDLLGPYPFAKFAVVENFLPTGYGMPSWTLLGKSVVRLPFLLDTSLPHEIVHSWWGNAVEVDYTRGNWAEGLTTYLADYLLKERDNPGEAREYRRKLLRDYAALVTPAGDFPLSAFIGRTSKAEQAVGYGKAAMVFHLLRREVGEEVFWQTLRTLAVEGRGRTLGWGELETAFSKGSGKELRWFFRQWVETRGAPQLALAEVRRTKAADSWTVSGTIRQQGETYRLEVPVILTSADGKAIRQTVRIIGARTPFTFTVPTPPERLDVDPDSHLFRRLHPEELPATVNDLRTPQRPLVLVTGGRDDLFAAAGDLLKGLQWQDVPVASETVVTAQQLADRDVLLIGWPTRKELQPNLPEGLKIHQGRWQVSNAGEGGDALFAVLAGRRDDTGVRAVLLADDPGKVRQMAAKVAHYGRYSLLLFAAGRNLVKTTWEPEGSRMSVSFTRENGS